MANRPRAASQATAASAEAYISFQAAWRDRIISDAEAIDILCKLKQSYLLNETMDVAEDLCNQLRRIPDACPNRPLMERIESVAGLWREQRKRLTSGISANEPSELTSKG